MIRYPLLIPGAHPSAEQIFEQDVYVEALLNGPVVGFATHGESIWIDMPLEQALRWSPEISLNAAYHYVGRMVHDKIVLTDITTRTGPLDHEAKFVEADRLGMECVQLLHAGPLESAEQLRGFLQQSPTGVAIKPITVQAGQRVIHVEITPDMFMDAPSTDEVSHADDPGSSEGCDSPLHD
jgi:hypothetical protein